MNFSSPADIFGVDGIIIVIVLALVLFGSTQIPKLARSLGSAQKEFKKGLDDGSPSDDAEKALLLIPESTPAAASVPVAVPVGTTQRSEYLGTKR